MASVLLWMAIGMVAAFAAKAKGKVGGKWFLLMLAMGPLGFIVVFLPDKNKR